MNEEFKNEDGSVRKNEHNLYAAPKILSMAKDVGLNLLDFNELADCGYTDQFICVLQKSD